MKPTSWMSGAAILGVILLTATVGAQDEELDPLAELDILGEALADTGPEGGGSIRAKRELDKTVLARIKDKRNLEGKVDQVKRGKFPLVAVRLKVTRPAKDGPGKGIKKNSKLVVVPTHKISGSSVEIAEDSSIINAGAYFLKRGDRVVVRLGEQRKNTWSAEYIERK